jgi:hypothetical protein
MHVDLLPPAGAAGGDYPVGVHKTRGQRDPALAFPLAGTRDDADERRQANRAIAVSAIGLAVTGLAELLLAIAHARARWTGRTLRVEIEGWVGPDLSARDADALGRLVADGISRQLPQAGSFTWTTRAAPM